MKMLFIHQHFYPEESGTAKSCTEMTVYFESKGHDVTVITEFPNRSFKSIADSKENIKEVDIYKNVNVYRLKNKFQYSSHKIKRIIAYSLFAFNSFAFALRLKSHFDICVTIQALPSAVAGVLLKIFKRIPHYFYCTDMMPDLGIAAGIIKNKLIINLARIVEKFVYNNSRAVFAVTQLMADNIRSKTNNKNVFVLPDWVDVDFFDKYRYEYIPFLKEKYDLHNKKVFVYIGNIGFLQNLSTIVEVAKKMSADAKYKDYFFIIGGTGVQRDMIERMSKNYELTNIRFIGVVDRKHVPSFLELSSFLLMNYVDHPHMALYRSSKIFDYIMAQKPVIVGATGELAKIVEENKLGIVAHPSDPEDFFLKLKEIISLENKYRINKKDLIEKYSMNNVLSMFYERVCKVLNNR